MIPIWIFVFFIGAFGLVMIWERHDYNKMKDNMEILEHYLDLYISKYGPTFGIVIEDAREDVDADTK